ncbi:hypothetical protein E6O75_ATG10585 [Venturia nashicola]|uniref:Uncharacterized protein n=1 Tax=Venturia nashicola TaxID=86259 RepID=A0A4Z1NQ94_9PEZI|nr:hypothetical protein E6O75_ATG10585 [Venturia nashicola]
MASARREIFSVAQEVAQNSAALKQDRFTELNSIVDRLQAQRPKNGEVSVSFVAKVKWAFGRRSKAHDLREELNATQLTLLLILSTLNLSNEMISRRNSIASLVDLTTGVDVEEEQQVVDSLVIAQQISIENLREREREREIEEQSCNEVIALEYVAQVSIPAPTTEFTSTQPVPSETTSCPSSTKQAFSTKNAPVFGVFNFKRQQNGPDQPHHRIEEPSLESLEPKRSGKVFSQAVLGSNYKPIGTTLAIKAAASPATQPQTSSEHGWGNLSLHSTYKSKEALGAVLMEMNQAPMTDIAVPRKVKLFSEPHAAKTGERQDFYLSTPTKTQSLSTKLADIVSPTEILKQRIEREGIRGAAANEWTQPPVVAITASKAADVKTVQPQPVTRSSSQFPHAFERWEDLSARWEGLGHCNVLWNEIITAW